MPYFCVELNNSPLFVGVTLLHYYLCVGRNIHQAQIRNYPPVVIIISRFAPCEIPCIVIDALNV